MTVDRLIEGLTLLAGNGHGGLTVELEGCDCVDSCVGVDCDADRVLLRRDSGVAARPPMWPSPNAAG